MKHPSGHSGQTGIPASAEDAFARFLALRDQNDSAGEPPPSFDTWVRNYPEFEAELRQLESDWRGFDALLKGALEGGLEGSLFHRSPHASRPPRQFVQFEPERVVGDFRLLQRIGQGGMGEVWEAEQLSLHRTVALKFIRPDRLSERSQAYFDREARASGRLTHAGIVAVHATGSEGDLNWIAQELVPGSSTLKDFLRSAQTWARLPPDYYERVTGFVAGLCDALQVAHEAGVIHRDVKPQNILVTPDDQPKLTDFGLARLTDEAAFSGTYTVKGTPVYMSPEQALGRSKLIDHRTDVYSTGVVLYELLTLRRPYEGESSDVMQLILGGEPPDPRSIRPEVPPELAAIALKALERRPSDRYATAGEMAADLRRFLASEPVLARPTGPLRRLQKWARRHPTTTSVALLGALLAATTWFLSDRAQRASRSSSEARQDAYVARAWRAIGLGDMELAQQEVADFSREFPDDARAPLLLATGHARVLQIADMERVLARVDRRKDWTPLGPGSGPDASGMDRYFDALYRLAVEGDRDALGIARQIQEAMSLDPRLEDVAHFLAYVMHYAAFTRGGDDGEREAALHELEAHRRTLRMGDPSLRFVDALRLEIEGDYEGAIEALLAFEAALGEEAFTHYRGRRTLGRVQLRLYKRDVHANFEALNDAIDSFERSLERVPEDSQAWANLAQAYVWKARRTPNADQRTEYLAEAEADARRALELAPSDRSSLEALTAVEQARLVLDPTGPLDSARLEDAMAALREVDPDSRQLENAESCLLYAQGRMAWAADDAERAYQLYDRSAEHDLALEARIYRAELDFLTRGDYQLALSRFQEAEELWHRLDRLEGEDPIWLFTIFVWAFGSADKAGELDLAFEYREQALEMLRAGEGLLPSEVFNLTEFLATPDHAELQDCELAHRLLDDFDLEATFGSDPKAAAILANVRAACPR